MSLYSKRLWTGRWLYGTQANINNATPMYVRYEQKQLIRPAALSMARWAGFVGDTIIGDHING